MVVLTYYHRGAIVTDDYLTIQEAADLLRTPAETLRYWRQMGRGPRSFKMGRRVLYARTDLNAFVAEAMSRGQ